MPTWTCCAWRDTVKENSGSHAVFTEQGSASQMTTATVMDIISRLPGLRWTSSGCSVRLEDAPALLKPSRSKFPDMWIRPESLSNTENWFFFLNEAYMVTHLPACCGKDNFEKALLENGWGKVPNWECSFVHRQQGLCLSVYVDDRKNNNRSMRKKFMKWT